MSEDFNNLNQGTFVSYFNIDNRESTRLISGSSTLSNQLIQTPYQFYPQSQLRYMQYPIPTSRFNRLRGLSDDINLINPTNNRIRRLSNDINHINNDTGNINNRVLNYERTSIFPQLQTNINNLSNLVIEITDNEEINKIVCESCNTLVIQDYYIAHLERCSILNCYSDIIRDYNLVYINTYNQDRYFDYLNMRFNQLNQSAQQYHNALSRTISTERLLSLSNNLLQAFLSSLNNTTDETIKPLPRDEWTNQTTTYIYLDQLNEDIKDDDCSICMDSFKKIIEDNKPLKRINKCAHIFCEKCIYEWFSINSVCPLCKISL